MLLLDELGIDILFTPTYSSPLNPVEHVWALMKKHWQDLLASKNGAVTSDNIATELSKIINDKMQGKLSKMYKSSVGAWI